MPNFSTIDNNNLYDILPSTNSDKISWATGICEPIINLNQYGAKRILVSPFVYKSERFILIAGDPEPFDDASHICESLGVSSGRDKGSFGSGGSNAHRLFCTDPYDAKAIWASKTKKDGAVAYSSQINETRRIDRKRVSDESDLFREITQFLSTINPSTRETADKFTVFVLFKTFAPNKNDLTIDFCEYLDVMLPSINARIDVVTGLSSETDKSRIRMVGSLAKFLRAADHKRFSLNDVVFDSAINKNNQEITVTGFVGSVNLYLYDGLAYKSTHGWVRVNEDEEGVLKTADPYSVILPIDGALTLPFVKDKTMERVVTAPVMLWKNISAHINGVWGTEIKQLDRKETKNNFVKKAMVGETEKNIYKCPSVFVEVKLEKIGEVNKTSKSNNETKPISDVRFLSEAFRVNYFFKVSEDERSNCNKFLVDLLRAAKRQHPNLVGEIVKHCNVSFPPSGDELDEPPTDTKMGGVKNEVYFVDKHGNRLPKELDIGASYEIAYMQTISGTKLDEKDYQACPSWTITRRDVGGFDIKISSPKVKDEKGKLHSLTHEEFIKTSCGQAILIAKGISKGVTYPKVNLSFDNPESGKQYKMWHVVKLPPRHSVRPHAKIKLPMAEEPDQPESRWTSVDERIYVVYDGEVFKYNKQNEKLRVLYNKRNSREFKAIMTREIDEVARSGYHEAKNSIKGLQGDAVEIYSDKMQYGANLAVQSLMITEKVKKKLEETHTRDDFIREIEIEEMSEDLNSAM